MSAETSHVHENILDPEAWNERTVLAVSVSPWYKVANGARMRTVNLTHGNGVVWESVRKERKEPWSQAHARTTAVIRKLLRNVEANMHDLSL